MNIGNTKRKENKCAVQKSCKEQHWAFWWSAGNNNQQQYNIIEVKHLATIAFQPVKGQEGQVCVLDTFNRTIVNNQVIT